jgi:hypothetical protein
MRSGGNNDALDQAFRLVSIRAAGAPSGCVGRDWFEYRIAQGENVITGYRRGNLSAATAEVESIVNGLNERRQGAKGRGRPAGRPAAQPTARAPAPDNEAPAAASDE